MQSRNHDMTYESSFDEDEILHFDGALTTELDICGQGLVALWAFPGGVVYAVGHDPILYRTPK